MKLNCGIKIVIVGFPVGRDIESQTYYYYYYNYYYYYYFYSILNEKGNFLSHIYKNRLYTSIDSKA